MKSDIICIEDFEKRILAGELFRCVWLNWSWSGKNRKSKRYEILTNNIRFGTFCIYIDDTSKLAVNIFDIHGNIMCRGYPWTADCNFMPNEN